MEQRYIPKSLALMLMEEIIKEGHTHVYDAQKHQVLLSTDYEREIQFRLPISFQYPKSEKPLKYIFLIIQTESCSIGYYEGGELLDHKVYTAYAVRKKQGKSQIKYLKTRGKSKAGSRVRLASTVTFFEKINTRLQGYFEEHQIDRIAFSCSKILIPYLYQSKVACPFDKKDARLLKIPKYVNQANHEEMVKLHQVLERGEMMYDQEDLPLVRSMLTNATTFEESDDSSNNL